MSQGRAWESVSMSAQTPWGDVALQHGLAYHCIPYLYATACLVPGMPQKRIPP